jgi:endo-1,4-beta-xylanase
MLPDALAGGRASRPLRRDIAADPGVARFVPPTADSLDTPINSEDVSCVAMRNELFALPIVLSCVWVDGCGPSSNLGPGGPANDGGPGSSSSTNGGGSSSGTSTGASSGGSGSSGQSGSSSRSGGGGSTGSSSASGSGGSSGSSSDGGLSSADAAAGDMDASTGDAGDAPCPPATPKTGGTQYCGSSGEGSVGNTGYSYNLYSDGQGSGCMTVYGVDATFKANWMNVGDWIGRVGLSFDKTKTYDQIGTFSSDFAYTMTGITTGGFGNIGIYGWSVSPLHEYYIAENWLGKKPNFTKVGTFTIDGEGTYDVMTNTQTNQPNITGTNATFVQFWSVRQTPRECGHVSISKHFAEWASLGLQLGDLEEARILVEAQNNSGTIDFTTATVVVTK